MGVNKFGIRGLMPEMSNRNHCRGSPVASRKLRKPQSPVKNTSALGIFNGVPNDDLDDITFKMKLKLGQEEISAYPPASSVKGNPNLLLKYGVANHELSTSLPNLTAAMDTELINEVNEKPVRSSLSDIFDSRSDGTCPNKPLTELAKCVKTLSSENLIPNSNEAGTEVEIASGIINNKPSMNSDEITVEMEGGSNRLSAVLENIPLLYIPHTKQLVSITPHGTERHTSSPNGAQSPPFSPQHRNSKPQDNLQEDSYNVQNGMHEQLPLGDTSISTNGNGFLTRNQQSFQNSDNSLDDSQTNLLNCGGKQDCSFGLSQDSDTSSTCRSEHTVIHQDDQSSELRKNSRTVDFEDEEGLLQLGMCKMDPESHRPSIERTNTMGSLSKADASSFSSISSISTATDFSASAASCSDDYLELKNVGDLDESGFMEVNLHSRNTFERSRNSSQDSGIDEKQCLGAKPKRRGLSSFFGRSEARQWTDCQHSILKNLFSWKPAKETQTEVATCESTSPVASPTSGTTPGQGWRLFGRIPPKQVPQKDSQEITKEYQSKSKVTTQTTPRGKRPDVEAPSTTALILENRPSNLPSKDPVEDLRHRLEYDAMIEASKKREQRESKLRKKQQQQQLRQEESLAAALKVWNSDILPNWETSKHTKKARDLWWQGIPPAVRGKVWQLAIGNELNLTPELYEICLNRAKDRIKLMQDAGDSDSVCSQVSLSILVSEPLSCKESSVDVIKLDVSRTFPQLCIFQKGGPYYDLLQGLLGAYACYRPDVGYVQGMSFIAAVLLLNMEVGEAFSCFANLLNRPCQIAFFRLDESLMKAYFSCYEEFFNENHPRLFTWFQKQGLTPDLYIIDWLFTLYAKSLPFDVASRVWDVFCRDGEEFLFRTALGILRLYEDILLSLDFIHLAQFLTKLPENISADCLFRAIDSINMTIEKKRFAQVLTQFREPKET